MAVFAMSSIASINVGTAHGGCGQVHQREPGEALWYIECEACENFLRHDPHFSVTAAEIPETFDEAKAREDFEKRGAKDKDAILTLAIARLAGIDSSMLPESLTRMISGAPLHVPGMQVAAGQIVCPAGHANAAGKKFCGDCGESLHGTPADRVLPAPQKAAETPKDADTGKMRRIRDARLDELQALCAARGVDPDGTRAELISRLGAAGVTNKDLADLRESLVPA